MAYPDKINALVDVTADQTLAAGGHAARHNDVNDALDELEAVFTAPAANELALRPDGSTEAVRIDSSGNVGIGTTNPDGRRLHIADDTFDDHLLISRSGASDLHISLGNAPDRAFLWQGASNDTGLYLHPAGKVTVPTGPLTVGVVAPGSAGAGDLVVNGGVFLGGSAAANELDDYEEGTWTPTYTTSGTDFTSVTYDPATEGNYTKIGRVVYISLQIKTDAITVGSASGNVRITGLPFTCVANRNFSVSAGFADNFADDTPNSGLVIGNSTRINLHYQDASDANYLALDYADMGTGTDDNRVYFSGFYLTDA